MIVVKTKKDCGIPNCGIPVCIWDGYNDKNQLEGFVCHEHAEDISPLIKKLSQPKIELDYSDHPDHQNSDTPIVDRKWWKGLKGFSKFHSVWHHGFEYSENLYFTYKTENLEKTYSLTGFEVVDGYLKLETWKRTEICPFYGLEDELRDRESRRYLNGLLEYLIMIDSGRRIPVRPNMSYKRKEARNIMRKQNPFRLKDVLGWKMFYFKDDDGRDHGDEEENIVVGHDYDKGRNNFHLRDFSPEEIRKISAKRDIFKDWKSISTLPENFTFEEIVTAHGMLQHTWIKKGEEIPRHGFEDVLEEMDQAA